MNEYGQRYRPSKRHLEKVLKKNRSHPKNKPLTENVRGIFGVNTDECRNEKEKRKRKKRIQIRNSDPIKKRKCRRQKEIGERNQGNADG